MGSDGAEGGVSAIQFTSPSIDSHDYVNPSVRVYELDSDTYQLIDYTQYYFDLGRIPCMNKQKHRRNTIYAA